MPMLARWMRWIPVAITVLALAPVHLPALLMFPYKTEAHGITVRSEMPLVPGQIEPILADAQRRLQTSALVHRPLERHSIYLTRGGWRWEWLAIGSNETFAVTRMFTENTIVNRSDIARNLVFARRTIGVSRSLSSDIAHEVTHSMIRDRFGLWTSLAAPKWAVEGYCDYVAGDSTLSAADVAELEAAHIDHAVVATYHARLRVTDILARNDESVSRLFAEAR